MNKIETLRAQLTEKAAQSKTIGDELAKMLDAEGEVTKQAIDDMKAKTKAKQDVDAEMAAIEDQIAVLVEAEKVKAARAVPAADRIATAPAAFATPKSAATFSDGDKIGLLITAMIKGFHQTGMKGSRAAFDSLDRDGYGSIAAEFEMGAKAVNSLTGSAGGVTVPPNFNAAILDMLTPMSAFLRGNPMRIDLSSGNYRQSAVASRPTVGYVAEGAAGTASSPTFREFTLAAKHLIGIVPVTNQIINYTGGAAATVARNTLAAAIGLKLDSAMLVGTGASDTPKGLFNLSGITTFAATNAVTPTPDVIDADTRKLLNIAESYGELQMGLAWVMAQRTRGYLTDLRLKIGSDAGEKAYPELADGMFKGYPVLPSAQIPINGGAGTNETTLGLVSFGNVLYGDAAGMTLAISEDATVGGVSMFETNQTAIRATLSHDVNAKYSEAVGTLTALKWGA